MDKVRIEGEISARLPRAYVTTRLTRVLDRVPVKPVTAHVRFDDVNGPKGGNDIRCAVVVKVPRQPSIRIEGQAPTARLAFEATYDRVVRQLERYRERWQDDRRHPKKYFAARRVV